MAVFEVSLGLCSLSDLKQPASTSYVPTSSFPHGIGEIDNEQPALRTIKTTKKNTREKKRVMFQQKEAQSSGKLYFTLFPVIEYTVYWSSSHMSAILWTLLTVL